MINATLKKMKKSGFVGIAALLLLALTLISLLPPLRIDLTEDKLYTLSAGTLNLIAKLDGEPVQMTFYYSDKVTRDIPTLRAYSRRVSEMLREYQLHSRGKIKLTIVDPEPFSENEDKAAALGLQGRPAANNDTIYFGLVVEKGSVETGSVEKGDAKREVITFFNAEKEASLEYDISQLIYRVSRSKPFVVGVISDLPIFQHRSMASPQVVKPKIILEQLRQMFDIKRVYDNRIEKIDDDIDLLMLVHPRLWPEQTLYAIDQFVLRGGRLLVFMDPDAEMDESEKGLFDGPAFQDRSSSLEQLLTAWGVQYDPTKILLDYQFAHAIPVTRYGQALPHVGVLGIQGEGINHDDAMTTSVDQVNLATTGVLAALPGASTQFTTLMQSSKEAQLLSVEAYQKAANHEVLLQQFKADNKGAYPIAAYISGPVKTAFADGEPKSKDPGIKNKTPSAPSLLASKQDISVVLFADTDILDDRMWVQVEDMYGQQVATPWASNSDLIVNVLEKLSGSVDLISVRGRGSYNRPFERVNKLERDASERLRAEQENLQASLTETEKQLQVLKDENQAQAEIDKFQEQRLQIRKKLREVRLQLNQDIEDLGTLLKVINILVVPILLAIVTVLMAIYRRKKIARVVTR